MGGGGVGGGPEPSTLNPEPSPLQVIQQGLRQEDPGALAGRDLFRSLQLGDTWPDAEMVQVWAYLYKNKRLMVPISWQSTMDDFNSELMESVP